MVNSDLSIGTIDSEGLRVLVARGNDSSPEMERAPWRSFLPFLRLGDKEPNLSLQSLVLSLLTV